MGFFPIVVKHRTGQWLIPQHHKFHKLFNRNKGKISYSCMPNMKSVINAQNKKILALQTKPEKYFAIVLIKLDTFSMRSDSQILSFIRHPYHQQKRVTEAKFMTE